VTTDQTLGGYQHTHERAPAFGGSDGRAYSVGTFVDETPDADGRYGAALVFVCWSDAGDRPVGHLETEYLAWGPTPAEALAGLLALSLHEVKDHLERCIERRDGAAAGPS
jgi:hypothetical protein